MNYAEMGTTALGKLVSERTGVECKSRNKPALIRKLEKMDAGKEGAVVIEASATPMVRVEQSPAEASAPAPKRARKSTRKDRVITKPNGHLAVASLTDKEHAKARATVLRKRAIHSDPALHAAALAAVRKAMSRKNPPALRELCKELTDKGIKTPLGRKTWWPSSIQSLLRQMEGK